MAPCCFRSVGREIVWLVGALGWVAVTEVVDAVISWVGLGTVLPRSVEELTAQRLSRLLGRPVTRVERHRHKEASEVGAGGTGTSRAWLTVYADRGHKVFVKLPAPTFAKRVFLTVFGVYRNELKMYAFVRKARYPPGLFADVECVAQRGNRFVLVLEDLRRSRDAWLPSVADPHPVRRVKVALEALADLHAVYYAKPLPDVGWADEFSRPDKPPTRPPFLRVVARATLQRVDQRFPGLLPPASRAVFVLFAERFYDVRRAWSTMAPLTLVHGDAHLGNMFFYDKDSKAGFYDLQCVAAEHPLRDVVYHLLSSCDPADLQAGGESALLEFYVDQLNAKVDHDKVPLHDALFLYRLHAAWVLAAFVISAGASDLFSDDMARLTLGRIFAGIDRLDTLGALNLLLLRANTNPVAWKGISP
ncbi:hypothetical protein CTAYLR_003110 [Chrysophaeum taylorii]|uniref:CHK kinase-like domain-containing protein n=1 Tax=Chrysophaeum taylorii TaxID=2483200 RepID=A0AAD7U5H8_9STRA|nr:hypothetical protein CTAYLR_003110 [Chrysophaeum taylorii]